jgi:hypothetical protein
MLRGLGRRLRRPATVGGPPALPDSADLEVWLYTDDCLARGRLHLDADRLTDMVAAHDSLTLRDVRVTALDDGRGLALAELTVARDEVVGITIAGPRGDPARHRRTILWRLALRGGPYRIWGTAHALPGVEPVSYVRRRGPIVPLSEVVLQYQLAGESVAEELPGVIVNLDLIEQVVDPDAATRRSMDTLSATPGAGEPAAP